MARVNARAVHERMMREDPEYAREYDALEEEFALIGAMLDARQKAGLTQAQVAERMGVKQPVVAKIEGGKSNVSFDTLNRYAHANGYKVKVEFVSS
ncbi:helix-turn-helix domain-containing protein [Desulfovibrio sulfodismutans]|uniref:Helix-turn-helix domain-containing protein n=1 Tax=Desulfolutivibrio sulfodismutans TaxID=63561 RepID=A0A7K3NI46_9BACT|nr:helix-turn-helix transcriptional regulator [Desulfolutivibrio sulfodismutans]NDY55858.1 helix-turn-helix domain-containing protein [Desulfolutivibrio sulfodismutans]QLA14260.1 helix-turn-helix domain-containing protein [Desulfolutivibrio sulfodismutans DSM 3696]